MKQKTIKPVRDGRIYIPSRCSDMSPHLDRVGGLATIIGIHMDLSAGKSVPFITVAEAPGTAFNWEILVERQEALRAEYGSSQARHTAHRSECGDGFKRRLA